ncbi:MAG: M20/M25/M40 family metallo-hydrolase [Candidatus Micrarchaeota archaeon]
MDPVRYLEALVGIESVFPGEAGLAHFLSKELERCGFDVRMQPFGDGRYNVLAERSASAEHETRDSGPAAGNPKPGTGNAKPLLLYGHMDTVPAYGYGQGRNPLKLEERDGRMHGLGAYDMKAGIAAIMQTVDAVRDGRALKIMFVSDEEAESRGCYEAVKSGFVDGVSMALAAEISDVHDMSERTRTITLGRRGRVQYQIDVPGKSFHAARAEEGISALTQAARIAIELESMEMPAHQKLSRGSQFVRSFSSSSESLSLPDKAALLVDRHLVFPESAESARAEMQDAIDRLYDSGELREADGRRAMVSIRPREVPYLMPFVTPEEEPEVQRLASAIRDALGPDVEPRYNYGMSVADENLLAMQGVPTASFGPIGGGEHSSGEWVSKRSYLELIEVLKRLIA